MSLKKAKFVIKRESSSESIDCSFNPSEYSISNRANYDETKTMLNRSLSFTSVSLRELKLVLYFSSVNNLELYALSSLTVGLIDPVTDVTQKIVKALYISGTDHRPPLVSFQWGNLDFQGFLTSVSETYTMFDSDGKPIRCKMDLTIKEAGNTTLSTAKEPFSSPDRSKWTTLTDSMSLWQIAYDEYGDAEAWRLIAKANGITNPLHVKSGQIIKIPAL